MLLQYAMEQGWELYNIYSDDDYTGSDRRRPEFNRLLKDAEQHKFDIILCKTQSRFTRELELVENIYMDCSLFGVFVLSALLTMLTPQTKETKNPVKSTGLSMNGTWKICLIISAAF